MSAIGRERSFKSARFSAFERPVLVKADICPGRVSAFRSKAVIGLEFVVTVANDPKRTLRYWRN